LAQEVGDILGLARVRDSLINMNDNFKVAGQTRTRGGEQKTYFLKESGLYWLIMRSNKPEANSFQTWICEDVLPSIRKTGTYELQHKCLNNLTFKIESEKDLHNKTVSFIKKAISTELVCSNLGRITEYITETN